VPRSSHRLDLLIAPDHPDRPFPADALASQIQLWRDADQLRDVLVGDHRSVRIDNPGRAVLYANHQGGYRVRCPEIGENIALAFSNAVTAWRAGSPRVIACPACGKPHALESVTLSPAGVFARGAVIFTDVGDIAVSPWAQRIFDELMSGSVVVHRRVG